MLRIGFKAKFLFSLLCVLVVAMRISGAHLHLCFDGSEPPASVHFDGDGRVHHAEDGSHDLNGNHSDVDVSLTTDALLKLGSADIDLLGVLAALSLLVLLFSARHESPTFVRSISQFASSRFFIRPPLRGPPCLA